MVAYYPGLDYVCRLGYEDTYMNKTNIFKARFISAENIALLQWKYFGMAIYKVMCYSYSTWTQFFFFCIWKRQRLILSFDPVTSFINKENLEFSNFSFPQLTNFNLLSWGSKNQIGIPWASSLSIQFVIQHYKTKKVFKPVSATDSTPGEAFVPPRHIT